MDIAFTPEQDAFRAEFRRWIETALPADWGGPQFRGPADEGAQAETHAAWERKLHGAGYAGIAWPKAYGGQGLSIIEHLIVSEELGRRAAPEGINSIGRELVGPIILAVGSEEQKRHYLPRILSVEDIWCQGFSEPNAGSDLAAIATRAVRQGDKWVVTGQKIWTSFARHAQMCILLARTNPDAPKHKGITLFLLDMATPGTTIRPLVQITGRPEFNEVFLDSVEVPDSMRLGPVDEGWRVATRVLSFERATNRLYRQQRFMHEFRALLQDRARSRPEMLEDAGRRRQFGALYGELMQLRWRNLRVASRVAEGKHVGPEASYMKLQWSELHQRMTRFAADAFGSDFAWLTPETDRFQDLHLQARAETIYAGTSEIQRNIIADRILELPR